MTEHLFAQGNARGREASILMVEDDPGAVESFEHMLKAEGYGVRVASDAQTAFIEVERSVPAAVILDLHLPITDGLEVSRAIRWTRSATVKPHSRLSKKRVLI